MALGVPAVPRAGTSFAKAVLGPPSRDCPRGRLEGNLGTLEGDHVHTADSPSPRGPG